MNRPQFSITGRYGAAYVPKRRTKIVITATTTGARWRLMAEDMQIATGMVETKQAARAAAVEATRRLSKTGVLQAPNVRARA